MKLFGHDYMEFEWPAKRQEFQFGAYGGALHGMQIVTSEYMGKTVTPEPEGWLPLPKGPYRQRREKRRMRDWRRIHPSYQTGDGTFLLDRSTGMIYCHPDDLKLLKSLVDREEVNGARE